MTECVVVSSDHLQGVYFHPSNFLMLELLCVYSILDICFPASAANSRFTISLVLWSGYKMILQLKIGRGGQYAFRNSS